MLPTFELLSFGNFEECGEKGEFRFIGKFLSNINLEMTFNLPLSVPNTTVRCILYEVKANEEVELFCKVQKLFKLVNYLILWFSVYNYYIFEIIIQ